LNGITMLMNNYYNGSPSDGLSAGMWIVTKAGAGGSNDATHAAATTYAVDVGLGISGIASAAATAGFTVGIDIGGASASGWATASSRIGTGLRIQAFDTYGLRIPSFFAGAAPTAISVANGAGPVVIGADNPQGGTSAELFSVIATATKDPLIRIGDATASRSYSMWWQNSNGIAKIGQAGAVNAFMTGTAAGDMFIQAATASKSVLIGGTTSVIAVKQDNTLGFFAATSVAQQAGTGETVGFTAGGGTTVTDASTFTGNVGSKAYRISDIVKALKNYGLLAAS
jgi:hypothetical protein